MKPVDFFKKIENLNDTKLLNYLIEDKFIKKEYFCDSCKRSCFLRKYTRSIDSFAWRCLNSKCLQYKKYISLRKNSFYEDFNLSFRDIFLIILFFISRVPRFSMINYLKINKNTILKVVNKIIEKMPDPNFYFDKLGGENKIVQIDETMLNYKVKSHRGRPPKNRTDALCIIEFDGEIKRVFACIIENKEEETIVPIICSQVACNTTIWTDEHGAYANIGDYSYVHDKVCHFIYFYQSRYRCEYSNGECFNNLLKKEIKSRMGVKTNDRSVFLEAICFYYNNKSNYMDAILNLI
ncbi:hypothetical protein EQH57_0322 [Dictyocoela roeselum]|nr:hypothetical protein EQH57_0322 [Dictyocoela roeselum]